MSETTHRVRHGGQSAVPDPWPAPYLGSRPVTGTVRVPGSKSLTNRYLVLAALAAAPSVIRGALDSRDSRLMIEALRVLGARIEHGPHAGELVVTPLPHDTTDHATAPDRSALPGPAATEATGGAQGPAASSSEPPRQIACGLAGTVMRFVPPVAALRRGTTVFDGDATARVRPMGPVLEGLRALGVTVDDDARGTLPFTVTGTGRVPGGTVTIDASGSSQFVSALLLAAVRFDAPLELRHEGEGAVPSLPHVEMTLEVLREAGVSAERTGDGAWRVTPTRVPGLTVTVEPDLSNAGPFLAAAVATGGTVRVPDWPEHTTQGGDHWRRILPAFGADVSWHEGTFTVTGPQRIRGVDVDLSEAGELAPTVAALCALADTPSRLRGIAHLRGHETDRLAALSTELNRCGGDVTETADGLSIRPAPLHGARFETYEDHRMATAGAIIGLRVPGIEVVDVATTAKTLPQFPAMWRELVDRGA